MVTTTTATTEAQSRSGGRFYVWMAVAYIVVAFGGFTPTYWAPVAMHRFHGPPILHVHGIILSVWVLFYFAQTWLVAQRRVMDHRSWGLAGISLFTLVVCTILATQLAILKYADAVGFGESARRFAAVPLVGLPVMAGFFAFAIVYVRAPEFHKRFMVLLMSAMMTPAIARVFLMLLAPGGAGEGPSPPAFVSIPPAMLADLFIVVALLRDWRMLGRPHPVYVYGGLALLGQQIFAAVLANTAAWMSFVTAFEGFAG